MNLSEKILRLRKQRGMSQEELAERLGVSRQAVSRWEVGSAQPDASNVLQLSKLFEVTCDYLLNDDCEETSEGSSRNEGIAFGWKKLRNRVCLCMSACGFLGSFAIYILSRFIKVKVPLISYDEQGDKWYTWSSDQLGYSYTYFIQEHNLELIAALFWILAIGGLIAAFANREKIKEIASKLRKRVRHSKGKSDGE